jgi:hypothetical protein
MKKKLMIAIAAMIAVATAFPMAVSASTGNDGPISWVRAQWNAIWNTEGIEMAELVKHTQHVITVVGDVFQIIFGNPFFLLLMMFSVVGAGVGLFKRIRRTAR